MKIFFLCVFFALVFGIGGYFYLQKQKDLFNNTNFAAKVNQKIISLEEFEERLNLIVKIANIPYKNKNFDRKNFRRLIMDTLIEKTLILEEVENINFNINDKLFWKNLPISLTPFLDYEASYSLQAQNLTIDFWKARSKEVALKNYFFQHLKSSIAVSQEEMTSYYTRHLQDFVIPEHYEILHIQVESREVAEFLMKEILKGASFTRLVSQYSIGEQDFLGEDKSFIVKKGQLPQNFERAILNLKAKKNRVSLVESDYGFHIFRLKKIIPKKKLTIKEAREQVIAIVKREKLPVVFKDWLKKKKKNSFVLVNQQLIANESSI